MGGFGAVAGLASQIGFFLEYVSPVIFPPITLNITHLAGDTPAFAWGWSSWLIRNSRLL
jgi:hypothetical protein